MHSKADNYQLNLPHCTITELIMTRNSKTKTKNVRSTGGRQAAVESDTTFIYIFSVSQVNCQPSFRNVGRFLMAVKAN